MAIKFWSMGMFFVLTSYFISKEISLSFGYVIITTFVGYTTAKLDLMEKKE